MLLKYLWPFAVIAGAIQTDVEVNYAVCPTNAVAWMECNGIRGIRSVTFPDYTSFHPGYERLYPPHQFEAHPVIAAAYKITKPPVN
jgi:hypothetical protein